MLQTYFVEPSSKTGSVASTSTSISRDASVPDLLVAEMEEPEDCLEKKIPTLVNWNTQIFEGLLVDIAKRREATGTGLVGDDRDPFAVSEAESSYLVMENNGETVRDELTEAVNMPTFDPKAFPIALEEDEDENSGLVNEKARSQLKEYISLVSKMYPPNPFHNFEHASHVMMSVVKLLQRISTRDVEKDEKITKKSYFDYTYGISSDPLTKFAIAFSALVHDADHPGVPNAQLGKENPELAVLYKNKSLAEQNSVDLAWSLLMEPTFKDLRAAIYANEDELQRFRQLVVNCVIATDIFDKELKTLRERRWERTFPGSENPALQSSRAPDNQEDDWNRKATIVIEYIIQASDVAHTMQHWHIYQKWNTQLFKESYLAYKQGRAEKNPSIGWYEGEIWFFNNYIIPLAKKLRQCKVFGVACDEFLDFAVENRKEWEMKGKEIVANMVRKIDRKTSSIISDEIFEDDELSYEDLKE